MVAAIFFVIAFPVIVISDTIRWGKEDIKNDRLKKAAERGLIANEIIRAKMDFLENNKHLSDEQIQKHERWIYLDNEYKGLYES